MTFNKKLISELGFEMVKHEHSPPPKYGRAQSLKPKGKMWLYWNHDYYGKGKHHLTIKEDGQTRQVFHGEISNKKDLKLVLSLVR